MRRTHPQMESVYENGQNPHLLSSNLNMIKYVWSK